MARSVWSGYAVASKIVIEITVMIAGPAISAAFLGKWIDTRFHSSPIGFIICLALAAILTVVLIRRNVPKYANLL
jgi:F0F1-type ATP synthase assembly protein I